MKDLEKEELEFIKKRAKISIIIISVISIVLFITALIMKS